jgi:hypothetical protein
MLTPEQLGDLSVYLDEKNAFFECDNTLKYTKQWIEEEGLSEHEEEIINFLNENGGYCDCEVILNVIEDDTEDDELDDLEILHDDE